MSHDIMNYTYLVLDKGAVEEVARHYAVAKKAE